MSVKVLFVDRDGTLIEEPPDNQVDALEKIRLVRGVISALTQLADSGYRFVMVSNQDSLGTKSFSDDDFKICQDFVIAMFESQGITFDEVFICPHTVDDACECRKPRTGLLTRYLADTNIDTENSAVIGDRDTDMALAEKLGIQGIIVSADSGWASVCTALNGNSRHASVERNTNDTSVKATVNLDKVGPINIDTGIGFYDNMLEQIAKHAGFSLQVACEGDLEVDEHHTVEDTAICLGTAIRQALGEKRGIGRYGFLLPMDESEARVTIDLSGRSNFVFKGNFQRESVGGLATELVPHFFRSLSESLGAALHIEVSGDNAHHMVEACFTSVGRTLRQAFRCDGDAVPSTKGTLS